MTNPGETRVCELVLGKSILQLLWSSTRHLFVENINHIRSICIYRFESNSRDNSKRCFYIKKDTLNWNEEKCDKEGFQGLCQEDMGTKIF